MVAKIGSESSAIENFLSVKNSSTRENFPKVNNDCSLCLLGIDLLIKALFVSAFIVPGALGLQGRVSGLSMGASGVLVGIGSMVALNFLGPIAYRIKYS